MIIDKDLYCIFYFDYKNTSELLFSKINQKNIKNIPSIDDSVLVNEKWYQVVNRVFKLDTNTVEIILKFKANN